MLDSPLVTVTVGAVAEVEIKEVSSNLLLEILTDLVITVVAE